ncbi:hypothetical protein EPUS_09387 [Endocarpon pusillum Z07020]|uniref:Heterokaryon incompatibility domain-containing protein n=1 Tax=Endocarpon pusillum (strain Z07020 / HMAS-L-300199) TaxID=1263415 RepID=U1GHK6_ENDPU|nr:uncharacterized protein EPUS_09387 [Endocarpon pusillum Z07020]ERF77147.1 hypothetical protein EPUS_09387 [Endocarpon pusillum Z07020]
MEKILSLTSPKFCMVHWRPPRLCEPIGQNKDRYHCMLQNLKKIVETCVNEHIECSQIRSGQNPSIVPTRLIEVGATNPPQPARLIKPKNASDLDAPPRSGKLSGYVTLSYCWGPIQDTDHRMFEDTEDAMMQSLTNLPKTIEEAISICQRMGVQYLWVDALCIMQNRDGHSEEWESEAYKVGNYYSNSIFTIAAGRAATSHEGCLPLKSTRSDTEFAVVGHDWTVSRSYPQISRKSPLWKRAWVLQEASLSTRILWFTDRTVLFLCKTDSRDCRDRPASHASRAYRPSDGGYRYPFEPLPKEPDINIDWNDMVEQYSRMRLTREEDRIIALAGITRYFNPKGEHIYLSGVWINSLPEGLLWRSVKTGYIFSDISLSEVPGYWYDALRGRATRRDNKPEFDGRDDRGVIIEWSFCAEKEKCVRRSHIHRIPGMPSWSWASLNTQVRYDLTRDLKEQLDLGCKSRDCRVRHLKFLQSSLDDPAEPDANGRTKDPYLRVSAAFGTLTFNPRSNTKQDWRVGGLDAKIFLDLCSHFSMQRPDGSITADCILAVHVCETKKPVLSHAMYVILLETDLERSGHCYRRIGVATIMMPVKSFVVGSFLREASRTEFRELLVSHFEDDSLRTIDLV